MNKFNLRKIIDDSNFIYRFGSNISLQTNVFNFKSDGSGWWTAVRRKNKNSWHGISINISTVSPLGYSIQYSPMQIINGRYCLQNEAGNVSRMAYSTHFSKERSNFVNLVRQIIKNDAEYRSVTNWIGKIYD